MTSRCPINQWDEQHKLEGLIGQRRGSQAEKIVFTISDTLASKERTPGKFNMIAQAPDSIDVVQNILSEL